MPNRSKGMRKQGFSSSLSRLIRVGLFMGLVLAASPAQAAYQGRLYVKHFFVYGDSVRISFVAQPNGCTGHYYSEHAIIHSSDGNFEEKIAVLLTAKSLGHKIDISYTNQGSCTSLATLMKINGIRLSATP